jgi:hypothetical protein
VCYSLWYNAPTILPASGTGSNVSVVINSLFDGENISFDASLVIYIYI